VRYEAQQSLRAIKQRPRGPARRGWRRTWPAKEARRRSSSAPDDRTATHRMATGPAEPVVGVEDGPAHRRGHPPRPQSGTELQELLALPSHIGRPGPRNPVRLQMQRQRRRGNDKEFGHGDALVGQPSKRAAFAPTHPQGSRAGLLPVEHAETHGAIVLPPGLSLRQAFGFSSVKIPRRGPVTASGALALSSVRPRRPRSLPRTCSWWPESTSCQALQQATQGVGVHALHLEGRGNRVPGQVPHRQVRPSPHLLRC